MVHRRRQQILVDTVIAARRHVDILAIAGLLLLQMALDEFVHCAIEVLGRRAIVLRPNFLGLDWLREVRRNNVLPVRQQRALEHILELEETLLIPEVDFCASAYKVGNGPRDGELGSKLPAVRVDFGDLFLTVHVATQLVGLWEFSFLVPGPFYLEKGCFFEDASHSLVFLA